MGGWNMLERHFVKALEHYKLVIGDDAEKIKQLEDGLAAQVKEAKEEIERTSKERGEQYASDKIARDAAAFAVLDKNNDGKLMKEAVVEGLTPDTDTHYAFLVALGMMTEDEVQAQKQAKQNHEAMISGAQLAAQTAAKYEQAETKQ